MYLSLYVVLIVVLLGKTCWWCERSFSIIADIGRIFFSIISQKILTLSYCSILYLSFYTLLRNISFGFQYFPSNFPLFFLFIVFFGLINIFPYLKTFLLIQFSFYIMSFLGVIFSLRLFFFNDQLFFSYIFWPRYKYFPKLKLFFNI